MTDEQPAPDEPKRRAAGGGRKEVAEGKELKNRTIRIDDDLYERFAKAAGGRRKVSALIRKLMREHLRKQAVKEYSRQYYSQ